jgi:hypothetical protein
MPVPDSIQDQWGSNAISRSVARMKNYPSNVLPVTTSPTKKRLEIAKLAPNSLPFFREITIYASE